MSSSGAAVVLQPKRALLAASLHLPETHSARLKGMMQDLKNAFAERKFLGPLMRSSEAT
jgi:hypothetical protein